MIWVEIGPDKFIQLEQVRKVWFVKDAAARPNAQIEFSNGDKIGVLGKEYVDNLKYALDASRKIIK